MIRVNIFVINTSPPEARSCLVKMFVNTSATCYYKGQRLTVFLWVMRKLTHSCWNYERDVFYL